MYRCVSKACDENIDFAFSSHQDIILHGREKEYAFRPRILLSCGHSVCENCIFTAVSSKQEEFIKCDDCGKVTSFSRQTIQTIKVKRPQSKESVRWNEDCEDDLLYEAFSIGAAFNSGRISVSATPIVDLDESLLESQNLPSHSYRNEPEVLTIRDRVSNASDSFKLAVDDGISMYTSCSKSLKFLFDTKTALNKQFVSTKEAIRKRFHVLHGLLQLEETNLIRELVKSKENTVKSLQEKEKSIDSARTNLRNLLIRSPQYAHIQTSNPFKHEIDQYRMKPLRIDLAPELSNHLSNLNKPHDDLHQEIKKLTDFRKAVRFDLNIAFAPLISSNHPASSVPVASEAKNAKKRTKASNLYYTNFIRQQLVTIHDVKDSGYFSAHLPSDQSVATSLAKALEKWCSHFLHPPCISKIKPSSDLIVWHDQKLRWARAKFKRVIEDTRQSEKENYYLLNSNLSSKKVEVSLVDFGDEIYETLIENVRESCCQLTDPTTYPPLLKAWKCRLKDIQPSSSNIRPYILKFCATGIQVRLLVLTEPIDDIYEVDIVHDIRDLVNPQPTLIEFLIFSNVAKLKDPKIQYPYPPKLDAALQYRDADQLKVGDNYAVDLTFIKNPHSFFVVVSRLREKLESLEKKINDLYSNQTRTIAFRLYYPRIYIPCAARCELFWDRKKKREKIFHRGYIIPPNEPTPPGSVTFFAVDYGECVYVPLVDLRILPDCFVTAMPKSAIQCSLSDIVPLDSGNWSRNSILAFREFFQATDTPTAITVTKSPGEKKTHSVVLNLLKLAEHHPDGNLNEILVKEGFAIKSSDVSEIIDITKDNSSFPNNRTSNNRFDFNCYSLIQDMARKSKSMNLGTIDSLIPIKITAFNSPESFFIQINTPEIQTEISNYMKRLGEMYDGIDISRRPVGQMQGFDVGEQCIYLFRDDNGYSTYWRRGLILSFLGEKQQQTNGNNSTDPRQMKQVAPDSLYKLRDRDFGNDIIVKRKNMLQLQPASPHRKDGEKCIQVCIPGIKHSAQEWSPDCIEYCRRKLRTYHGKLFIKIEDNLTATQPEKLPVDCIFLAVEIPDACLPSEDHYYSLRYDLLETGNAALISEHLHFESELKIDDDSAYADIQIPLSIRDDSLLSSLRSSYYNENQVIESIKYMDAKRPEVAEFNAVCTHVEDGPSIYFTILEEPSEPSIGTINKTILRKLLKQEKLLSFKGNVETGRACTVYNDSRWCRAEILSNSTNNNKITVRHVDTGVTKDYFIDKMSSEVFCEGIPKLAFEGRLDRCAPFVNLRADIPAKLKAYLTENLIGKKLTIKWENFGSSRTMLISVFVQEKGRDLKSMLLNLDLIQESQVETEELPQYIRTSLELMEQSEYNFLNHQFIIDKFYPVIIADYVRENYLYVQLISFKNPSGSEEEDINAFHSIYRNDEEFFNSNAKNFYDAVEFNVGNSCLAKWNGEWFRGIVSAVIIPKLKYEVFFVDWGNTDTVEKSNMKILPLNGHPIFGFFVRLSNLKPARQGVWNQRLYDMMKAIVDKASSEQQNFLVKFKSTTVPFDVELWTANDNQQPVDIFFSNLISDRILQIC